VAVAVRTLVLEEVAVFDLKRSSTERFEKRLLKASMEFASFERLSCLALS